MEPEGVQAFGPVGGALVPLDQCSCEETAALFRPRLSMEAGLVVAQWESSGETSPAGWGLSLPASPPARLPASPPLGPEQTQNSFNAQILLCRPPGLWCFVTGAD